MTKAVKQTLEHMRFGTPQQHRNLCVVPIFYDGPAGPVYQTLTEALQNEQVTVTEISEGGAVPNLKVTNQADQPLVLVDGEELVGAKQNRIVNTTMMLEANSETTVPVSCTEAGRWRYNSRRFADAGVIMAAKARYKKSERLMHNLRMKAQYDAGQAGVWKDIDQLHRKSGSHSRTRAMHDAYLQRAQDMEAYMKAFPRQEGQQGMVVFLNGRPVGADFLSRSSGYAHLHDKLLKSHVIEAVSEKTEKKDAADWAIDAHQFLRSLLQATEVTTHQPIGLGTDYRFNAEGTKGAALVYEEAVIHLSSYASDMVDVDQEDPRRVREEFLRARRRAQQDRRGAQTDASGQKTDSLGKSWRDFLQGLFG